jgi:formate hydrogenlyase subunit 6/NADH:ubiquinone oxidoreductase subunit I
MPTPMFFELFRQLFKKPATNKFPVKYTPPSVIKLLEKVKLGKLKINPPIELPPEFRGKISYEIEKCTGCASCTKVCPSNAIELVEAEKAVLFHEKEGARLAAPMKIKIYVSRCSFCSQCVEVCPRKCLKMTTEFLLADYDKYSDNLVVK